jgi:DNA-binding response OmpR family regulator
MSLTIPKGHEQVLVIDDDEFIVKILEAFLKQQGHQAITATSGSEALRMFLEIKEQISLVILDQTLPDISGAELAAKLRNMRPNIPIVMFSGYGEEDMRRETKGLGINAYMRKPVTYDQLAKIVRKVLDSAQDKVTNH